MAHSKIGASSMKRWENCPGSVKLSAGIESPTSEHAALGTSAHFLAETCLLTDAQVPGDYLGHKIAQDTKGQCWFEKKGVTPDGGWLHEVDAEMVEATTVHVEHVRALVAEDPDATLVVEQRFHLHQLHEDLFGTGDAVVWQPNKKHLHVCDYKHGAGVMVDAVGNPQLRYYGLGAMLENDYRPLFVSTHVIQPRIAHRDGPVRQETLDVLDMLDFSERLLAAAKATEDPNAPLVPGEWCNWCPAAVKCPKLVEKAQETAALDFAAEKDELTPEQIAQYMEWVAVLEAWCKNVRQYAYDQAESGHQIPGHKLVEKRATRKWADEKKTVEYLKAYGLDDQDLYSQKLKTPPQIEKVVGKSGKDMLDELVIKESSGLALVSDSDKRPAVASSAVADFKDS